MRVLAVRVVLGFCFADPGRKNEYTSKYIYTHTHTHTHTHTKRKREGKAVEFFLLEKQLVLVEMQSSTVADAHVQRAVFGVVAFGHRKARLVHQLR